MLNHRQVIALTSWMLIGCSCVLHAKDDEIKELPKNPKLSDCRSFAAPGSVSSLSFSSDGKFLAVGLVSADLAEPVLILDVERGKQVQSLRAPGVAPGATVVRFSPAGGRLAVAREAGGVAIWNTSTWKQEYTFDTERRSGPTTLDFSSDGRLLAGGGRGRHVFVWDVQNRKLVITFPRHSRKTSAVAFSALGGGGRYLFTCGGDRTVNLWHVQPAGRTGDLFEEKEASPLVLTLPFPERSLSHVICWPQGPDFGVVNAGQPFRRWSLSQPDVTGDPSEFLQATFPRTGDTAAVSPDGHWVALSLFRDETECGIFDAWTGKEIATLKPVATDVLTFSSNSRTVALGRGIIVDARSARASLYSNLILWSPPVPRVGALRK